MIELDGAEGEGGGQVLRSALGLAVATGQAFHLRNVRAGRKKPGLLRQHHTAVHAAARLGAARVEGGELGSTDLRFEPSGLHPGHHEFSIGSAGSTGLVLQTLLPALMVAKSPSTIVLRGGTHNPAAPPFEFLSGVFAHHLRAMGFDTDWELRRPGFHPAGGGEVVLRAGAAVSLRPLVLHETGALRSVKARILAVGVPRSVADRERTVLERELGPLLHEVELCPVRSALGAGNVVLVEVDFDGGRECFVSFGARGRPAEEVAQEVVHEVQRFLRAEVPVGEHLADQLLLPLALAGAGSFTTLPLSSHARTNAAVVERFLAVRFEVEHRDGKDVVTVVPRSGGTGC